MDRARRGVREATSRELFAAAQALLATVSSLGSTSAETAASVRETTAAMGRLGETASQAAHGAEAVIRLTEASQKASQEGLFSVSRERPAGHCRAVEGPSPRANRAARRRWPAHAARGRC
jgi:hypothetical protein